MENFTKEQEKIITETIKNKSGTYFVEAAAGSGKSFTIFKAIDYIKLHEPNAKILYIVFNKANQISAERKLSQYQLSSSPVKVCTCNSYGYEKWLKTIGPFGVFNTFDKNIIYEFQKSSPFFDVKYSKHKPFKKLLEMYEYSKLTLDSFCKDIEFHFDDTYQGFDKPKYCELIGKNGEKVTKFGIQCDNYSVITKNHIPTFKKLIEYYLAEKKYTHGMYMKAVAYSNNEKVKGDSWDYVFFDEAQDANYFVLKLLNKQNIKKIYFVGDSRQSIYSFGGLNKNVFKTYKCDKRYTLSKSFRFGKAVCDIANIILNGDGLKLKGTEQSTDIDYSKVTRLYRTNAKLFKDSLDLAYGAKIANKRIKFNFMRTELDSKANDDMMCFIGLYYQYQKSSIYYQYQKFFNNFVKSETLQMFENRLKEKHNFFSAYNEFYDFFNDDIHTILNYIKEDVYFIDKYKALQDCKYIFDNFDYEITLVTMHRSKGLEWDNVVIAEPTKLYYTSKDGSIHKNSDFQQELNLAYVAATRSRKTLDASILITELEEFGIDTKLNTFKVNNGKEVLMKTEASA